MGKGCTHNIKVTPFDCSNENLVANLDSDYDSIYDLCRVINRRNSARKNYVFHFKY